MFRLYRNSDALCKLDISSFLLIHSKYYSFLHSFLLLESEASSVCTTPLQASRKRSELAMTFTSQTRNCFFQRRLMTGARNEPAFDNIKLKTEFYRFLDEIIATKLFYVESENETSDTESDLLANNELKGALRIQQMRVVNKTCDPNAESSTTWGNCFYETYSEDVACKLACLASHIQADNNRQARSI